jgi:hypothetical protein
MTKERVALPFRFDAADDEQQVPPLRFATVGMTLLFRNGQKNEQKPPPTEMTNLFGSAKSRSQGELSSRPERSQRVLFEGLYSPLA